MPEAKAEMVEFHQGGEVIEIPLKSIYCARPGSRTTHVILKTGEDVEVDENLIVVSQKIRGPDMWLYGCNPPDEPDEE